MTASVESKFDNVVRIEVAYFSKSTDDLVRVGSGVCKQDLNFGLQAQDPSSCLIEEY